MRRDIINLISISMKLMQRYAKVSQVPCCTTHPFRQIGFTGTTVRFSAILDGSEALLHDNPFLYCSLCSVQLFFSIITLATPILTSSCFQPHQPSLFCLPSFRWMEPDLSARALHEAWLTKRWMENGGPLGRTRTPFALQSLRCAPTRMYIFRAWPISSICCLLCGNTVVSS